MLLLVSLNHHAINVRARAEEHLLVLQLLILTLLLVMTVFRARHHTHSTYDASALLLL